MTFELPNLTIPKSMPLYLNVLQIILKNKELNFRELTKIRMLVIKILAYSILLLVSKSLLAQDSHYGTHQFGTRSALMGGAVVGFARDNSAIFYNSGSLAFVDSNSITISANVYQMENFSISDADGLQPALKNSPIGSVPLMVSGMLGKSNHRTKIGYGVISPVGFNFKASSQITGRLPVVNDFESPGNELFVGQSSLRSELNEVVGILGIGYKINRHWGIGISHFAIGRALNYNNSVSSRYYLNDANHTLTSYSQSRSVNYFHLRYSMKLGLCYRSKRFSGGFTILPPSIGVGGNGVVSADVLGTNVLYDGVRTNVLLNDRQENLKVRYKSPFSMALGANWTYSRVTYGLSLEYYAPIDLYTVLDSRPSELVNPLPFYNTLNNKDFLTQKDGAKQVFNFAFAFEYVISRHLTFVSSLRTNQSFYSNQLKEYKGLKTEITTWDLYHLRGGLIIKQGHSQLSIGLIYGTGSDSKRSQINEFSIPDELRVIQPQSRFGSASYSSIGFLLGYSFLLFDI